MPKYVTYLMLLMVGAIIESQGQHTVAGGEAEIEFVKIPAGSFLYGRFVPPFPKPIGDSTVHDGYSAWHYAQAAELAEKDARAGFLVSVDSFFLGKYEVTQQQWRKIMGDNPSTFKGDKRPVENVSWKDAMTFVKRLNAKDDVYCYRLPTEFEWEYAARAGAADDISWAEIGEQAHLGKKETIDVGEKKPNKWGLYDMLGNVWEWTADWYNERLFADSVPLPRGSQHVLKGASFTGDVKNATYMTHAAGPGNRWDVGLRLVMERKGDSRRSQSHGLTKERAQRRETPGWHLSRTTHQGTVPKIDLENGTFTLMQNPYGQGGVLLTNEKYRDFEMTVDVKIDSFCNGGIFLRSTESGQAYQIELSEPGGTGNLLGEMLQVSKPAVAKNKWQVWKPNDWNHFRIRMTGEQPRIILWINGQLMWDVQQPANDFVAGATEGMIGLQVHWSSTYSEASKAFDMSSSWRPGGKHQFRNVSIRKLK